MGRRQRRPALACLVESHLSHLIPLNPGESRFKIKLWLVTLFAPPTPPPRHGRTRSGHPRDRPLWRVWRKKMPGTSPGMTGEWSGLARPRAAWMPGYPEQVRASPAMTLVSPRAQGARCGNIGRALGSFSNGMLPRRIPLISLNPGESRFRISVSRNPVSVSGCDASPPGHSLTPSCPDSFRASTALRRARPMELAGYPDTQNESGQVGAGLGMKRELSAKVSGLMDARIPGTSPGMPGHDGGVVRAGETEGLMDARIPGTSPGKSGHDVGTPCVVGRPRGWPGQARP